MPASQQSVVCVDTTERLRAFLAKHSGRLLAGSPQIVGIEFTFVESCQGHGVAAPTLGALAIAGHMPQVPTLVLVLRDLDRALVTRKLRELLADSSTFKVMHDVAKLAAAWQSQCGELLDGLRADKWMDIELMNAQLDGGLRGTISVRNKGTVAMEKQIALSDGFACSLHLGCLSMVRSDGQEKLLPEVQQRLVKNAQLLAKMFWMYRSQNPAKGLRMMTKERWNELFEVATDLTVDRWKKAAVTKPKTAKATKTTENVKATGPNSSSHGATNSVKSTNDTHMSPSPPPNDLNLICISTTKELKAFLKAHDGTLKIGRPLVLGIDFVLCEQCCNHRREADVRPTALRVGGIAIATPGPKNPVIVLYVESIDSDLLVKTLRALLSDPGVLKVTHGLDLVADAWRYQFGSLADKLDADNWVDIEVLLGQANDRMQGCISIDKSDKQTQILINEHKCTLESVPPTQTLKCGCEVFWPDVQQRLASNAHLLPRLYLKFRTPGDGGTGTGEKLSKGEWIELIHSTAKMTLYRWKAVEAGGCARVAQSRDGEQRLGAPEHKPATAVLVEARPFTPTAAHESERPVVCIATTDELREFLDMNHGHVVAGRPQVVGIEFAVADGCREHGETSDAPCLAAISIASASVGESAVILLARDLDSELLKQAMQNLMGNKEIVKVVHDVHRPALAWHSRCGVLFEEIDPIKFIDLQLLHEHCEDAEQRSISVLKLAMRCNSGLDDAASDLSRTNHAFKAKLSSESKLQSCRRDALTAEHLQQAIYNAEILAGMYSKLRSLPDASGAAPSAGEWATSVQVVTEMTVRRWENAISNNGIPAIWFDSNSDYQPRSLECLMALADEDLLAMHKLELVCDINPLLGLLPQKYRDAVAAIDDYHHRLVDVCLDVGRIPYVYVGKRQRVSLVPNYNQDRTEPEERVSKVELDEILELMGGEDRIGSDNRAGIDRQLHRISVMRSKTNEVYGITMRVGRTLQNAASVLTDLLLAEKHREKSVLLLGHPGSGKTTLIRDVARFISATQENVCIVDTSNEIGGDGLVPHECVGWARRMMVPTLEAQASVMIECVQNHTVETMIIDEIGRKSEVMAAATVRQRGPRLVASAHGDFRSLLKNPDLRGLVGGVQQVTVGDAEAKQSGLRGKLRTERAGNPIFDVIVELDRTAQGLCHIIWDVGEAVDCVLASKLPYRVETRKWNMNTRGVQVLS